MRTFILTAFILISCSGSEREPVDSALARGMAWILQQDAAPDAGTLHACLEIARLLSAPELHAWVVRGAGKRSADPFTNLVTGNPVSWQNDQGARGHARMHQHLLASLSAGRDGEAARALESFLAEELHGYMLTHQLYAVHWARERGWRPGAVVNARIGVLLKSLDREAEAVPTFSDLRAEQLQLLAAFGRSLNSADVESVLRAQTEAGSFMDATEWELAYDGEGVAMRSHPMHTTAQALLLLARVKASSGG